MFVNKYCTYLGGHISESKGCYNLIPSAHYFHLKTKMLADFQVCISVPLSFLCSKEVTKRTNGMEINHMMVTCIFQPFSHLHNT